MGTHIAELNRKQKGPNHPRWKGGRIITPLGYIAICRPGHPRASIARRYVLEHLLVMEQQIGRPVRRDEIVHHINGNKQDNRIENLELMSKAEHDRIHALLTDRAGLMRRRRAQRRSRS